jgi:hypothetical protein
MILEMSPPKLSRAAAKARLREAVEKNCSERLHKVLEDACKHGLVDSYAPFLRMLLNHDGQPYSLDDHFVFEPIYATLVADSLVLKTGRQLGKTSCLGSRGLLLCASQPYFSVLYVTPLFEQARRFSTQVVRKFIEESVFRDALSGPDTENSVLLRSFRNKAKYTFSFAGISADRVRGQSNNLVQVDEIQDMNKDHLPVIGETMSASRFGPGLLMQCGTPKSLDNTLQYVWDESSQAEWAIPCFACGKTNYPAMHLDLYKMIGPLRGDIGRGRPATVCAKCGRPVDARYGRWVHRYPARRFNKPGYHVPQAIMPLHAEDPKRWSKLLGKQAGAGELHGRQVPQRGAGGGLRPGDQARQRDRA